MLDYLYPQTIDKLSSKFNGEIKISKSRGKYSVWIGGFEQSGSVYVEKIWGKALKELPPLWRGELLRNIKVLVLGLGCGTVIPIIFKKWPKAKIVGVEIDPVMINLGEKYFGLKNFENLKIICGDAKKQKLSGYDLIITDAYLGGKNQLTKIKSQIPILSNLFNPKTLKNEIKVYHLDFS